MIPLTSKTLLVECVGTILASKALAMHDAPQSALFAGLSSFQVLSDLIILFSPLHLGLDLNEIGGLFFDNKILATLFTPLFLALICAQQSG